MHVWTNDEIGLLRTMYSTLNIECLTGKKNWHHTNHAFAFAVFSMDPAIAKKHTKATKDNRAQRKPCTC